MKETGGLEKSKRKGKIKAEKEKEKIEKNKNKERKRKQRKIPNITKGECVGRLEDEVNRQHRYVKGVKTGSNRPGIIWGMEKEWNIRRGIGMDKEKL